jgi:hypothetical protein
MKHAHMKGLLLLQKMQKEQMEFTQHHMQLQVQQMQQQAMAQQQHLLGALLEKINPSSPPAQLVASPAAAQKAGARRANVAAEIAGLNRAGSTDLDKWESVSKATYSKKVPHDDLKTVVDVATAFRKNLHLCLNTEQKVDSLRNRQEFLNKDEVPSGMKPYTSPWNVASLDEPASMSDTTINIAVPKDPSLGELRQLLYMKYRSLLAAVDWRCGRTVARCLQRKPRFSRSSRKSSASSTSPHQE